MKGIVDDILDHVWCRTYMQNGDLGQVLQSPPLSPKILHTAEDDDMLELVVVEVGGPQRHHKVPEPDQWGIWVSKEADHHVTIEDSHGRLVTVLMVI